mmetsp:Transcript_24610/g.59342  ORF Transcript_24610/g.59342 Transcript_24610/m.59342 type:complete len:136 (-) Transcript_24610:34-441(-)
MISNSTSSPSPSDLKPDACIALWCTNTSGEPSSGTKNPNPFLASNHFTVPFVLPSDDPEPTSSEKAREKLRQVKDGTTVGLAATMELRAAELAATDDRVVAATMQRRAVELAMSLNIIFLWETISRMVWMECCQE